MTLAQNWPKKAVSLWQSLFKMPNKINLNFVPILSRFSSRKQPVKLGNRLEHKPCYPSSDCTSRGSPIGFFNPVIPTHSFMWSRYFWHPTSCAHFSYRISPRFYFKIPNPEFQLREIPCNENPTGDKWYHL